MEPKKLLFRCLTMLVVAFLFDISAKEPQVINRIDMDNPYLLDSFTEDIETNLADWSLDKIEKYATSNNPLYLAEKQNISIIVRYINKHNN